MEVLVAAMKPTSGTACILRHDVVQWRQAL
ncbi:MAG: hypothetical protein ACE5GD_10620 [Candidatus Geothermarchaeales archaeon]